MEQPERAPFIGRSAFLVNVPDPARFALHKLISSQLRVPAFHAKATKDQEQAAQLLELLIGDRPADLESAWQGIHRRGKPWMRALSNGLTALEKFHPELTASIRDRLN
jgi:hypothetical protein